MSLVLRHAPTTHSLSKFSPSPRNTPLSSMTPQASSRCLIRRFLSSTRLSPRPQICLRVTTQSCSPISRRAARQTPPFTSRATISAFPMTYPMASTSVRMRACLSMSNFSTRMVMPTSSISSTSPTSPTPLPTTPWAMPSICPTSRLPRQLLV